VSTAFSNQRHIRVDFTESEDDKKLRTGGFRSAGHFSRVLMRGLHPAGRDAASAAMLRDWQGLVNRAATGMSEAVDPEGGVLVPSEFSAQIWSRPDNENLAQRLTVFPVSSNSIAIPANQNFVCSHLSHINSLYLFM
jgi:HK97 family phage major capsid protein